MAEIIVLSDQVNMSSPLPSTAAHLSAPHSSSSPLTHKRRRLDSSASTTSPSFQVDVDMRYGEDDMMTCRAPFRDASVDTQMSAAPSAGPRSSTSSSGDTLALPSPRMQHSVNSLEAASQAVRLRLATKEQSDKSTPATYRRHVDSYVAWWDAFQAAEIAGDSAKTAIPAFPITAAKATMFLDYTSTRAKNTYQRKHGSSETIPGSVVGRSVIKQTISALENHRFQHQHLYKQIPESQLGLRLDDRIRRFESAAKHNEPKRVESAQVLKASGSSSDTYTKEELERCSLFCLTDFSGPKEVFVGLRDRAMLLLSTTTAFRGASCRAVELSDLFPSGLPSVDPNEDGTGLKVLGILLDNAKHNQMGRTDEHGAIRHRHPELCPINGVGTLLWAIFHLEHFPVPDFVPDFSSPDYGEFGHREWYEMKLFFSSKGSPKDLMQYKTHNDRVNLIHIRNNVSITKSTHAGRPFAAQTARAHGASVDGTKALGGWSESGSFRPCYDRAFPADALLGAAMFNAQKPEAYCLPRDALEPPSELLLSLFPWVESEQAALDARQASGVKLSDIALKQFLRLLVWLRRVVLQDCAVLYSKYPSCGMFRYAPFNTPTFRAFASTSAAIVSRAEEDARHALKSLPDNVVTSFRGLATDIKMDQQAQRIASDTRWDAMESRMNEMTGMLGMIVGAKASKSRKRKKVMAASVPPTPLPVYDPNPVTSYISPPFQSFAPSPTSGIPNITINFTSGAPGSNTSPPLPLTTSLSSNSFMGASPQPPIQKYQGQTMTPIQLTQWNRLLEKYGEARVHKHQWEWVHGEFLPFYLYQPVDCITGYWTEWADGIGGFLSTRELTEVWGAKWRRNNGGQRTECGRRKKVVDMVTVLAARPNWDTHLALRFLSEKYETLYTPRKFCDWLKPDNVQAVLVAAVTYC